MFRCTSLYDHNYSDAHSYFISHIIHCVHRTAPTTTAHVSHASRTTPTTTAPAASLPSPVPRIAPTSHPMSVFLPLDQGRHQPSRPLPVSLPLRQGQHQPHIPCLSSFRWTKGGCLSPFLCAKGSTNLTSPACRPAAGQG
jgi:hypothetical protein